jgi:hypothetical protein
VGDAYNLKLCISNVSMTFEDMQLFSVWETSLTKVMVDLKETENSALFLRIHVFSSLID